MTDSDIGGTTEDSDPRVAEADEAHAVFTLDADGRIDTWTPSARALYGYDPDDVHGQPLDVLFTDADAPATGVADTFAPDATDTDRLDGWHERADGSVFWATLSISPRRDDGQQGCTVVSRDTTAEHQHRQLLERQNDRLKEFTDILVHDLRSPLNVILARSELARKTGDTAHLEVVERTAERMERLVDNLLRVARQGNPVVDPEPTDVDAAATTAWEGTGALHDGATLLCEAVGTVEADADRLCELFENLFRNAVEHGSTNPQQVGDAVEHGSTGNRNAERSESPVSANGSGTTDRDAGGVTVRVGPLDGRDGFYVEDDGPGIPEGEREEVFDHGFSSSDDGSGYGLSVVRTIAGAHGWDVAVTESEFGGARFEITGVEFSE